MEQHLIRKKSGELVKMNLRCPNAPTAPSKLVLFDCNLEHIRYFLRSDRPIAISIDPSLVDGNKQKDTFTQLFLSNYLLEWEIAMPNFTRVSNRNRQLVQLESLYLLTDCQNLVGTVTIANIAFEKHVSTRFITDNWQEIVLELHMLYVVELMQCYVLPTRIFHYVESDLEKIRP
jgi:hypothetical protein